jgi:hypothetical protein
LRFLPVTGPESPRAKVSLLYDLYALWEAVIVLQKGFIGRCIVQNGDFMSTSL